MIHYALRCAGGHDFDGWFPGSAAFEHQAASGLLECPLCGNRAVDRALMAPSLGGRAATPAPEPASPPAATPQDAKPEPPPMPAALRAVFARMRADLERKCDYVGRDFAAEARRMHAGDSDRPGIYGEATRDEAEALEEDGITFGRIPWVPLADS